ncbi:MAG: HupE/UreJ family protein [Bacteroidia bacterium]
MRKNQHFLFSTYFKYGTLHISDFGAYDHMLFLLTITVGFNIWHWKKVFWSVTGFTLGHSISLALATLNILNINSNYIEFAIPITIAISAIVTIVKSQGNNPTKFTLIQFLIITAFGIVHGAGFSGYLGQMLPTNVNIFVPLLSFNLGIETGQLLIVLGILLLNLIAEQVLKITKPKWVLFWMGGAFCLSFQLILENKLW